jgi:hypothetical protein
MTSHPTQPPPAETEPSWVAELRAALTCTNELLIATQRELRSTRLDLAEARKEITKLAARVADLEAA